MMTLLYWLRGALVALCLLVVLVVIAISIILFWSFIQIIPIRQLRNFLTIYLRRIPIVWNDLNRLILCISCGGKWDIQGDDSVFEKRQNYLLIANHLAWQDILILGEVFHRKTPPIKFFMKKELLWSLPIAGFACKVLGYPFLQRHSRQQIRNNPALKNQDIETTKIACQQFIEQEVTVALFPEGTRFTEKKQQQQQSPYQHLLKPKATGVSIILQEMQHNLAGIIDVNICYLPKALGLWQFMCGRFKRIVVSYQLLPITDDLLGDSYHDRLFRKHFQSWLNERWQHKDNLCPSSD